MGEEVCEEVEFKLSRGVSNHHTVGVGATEQFIGQFQIIVDFLRSQLPFWLIARQFGRASEPVGKDLQVLPKGLNKLGQGRMWHNHSGHDLCRGPDVLEEVDDELIGSGHYNNTGTEHASPNAVWHACRQMVWPFILRGGFLRRLRFICHVLGDLEDEFT